MSYLLRASPEKFTTPKVYPGASATSNLPEVIPRPEDSYILKLHSTIPRFLPHRGPYHSEVFPYLEGPNSEPETPTKDCL